MLEPFFIGQEADVTFRLVIHAHESEPFDAGAGEGLIMDVKDSQPYFKVYRRLKGHGSRSAPNPVRPWEGCWFPTTALSETIIRNRE